MLIPIITVEGLMRSMQKSKDIKYKVELIKKTDHKLGLNIHLNPEAVNVLHDENTITWTPNSDEENFLFDVLSLLEKQKSSSNITFSQKEKKFSSKSFDTLHNTIDTTLERKTNSKYSNNKTTNRYKDIEEIITTQ